MKSEVLLPDAVRHYLEEHKLQEAVTSALNGLLKALPEDPYGVLAEEFAKRAVSSPQFMGFRRQDPWPEDQLRFFIVVNIRGFPVRVHSMNLPRALFGSPSPPEGEDGEGEAAEAEGDPDEEGHGNVLCDFVLEFAKRELEGQSVDAFLSFHERCQSLKDAPHGCPDLTRATALLTDHLLQASANSMNKSCLGFLQYVLDKRGLPERASPPLQSPADFQTWQSQWPSLTFPVYQGGAPGSFKPSVRLCVALTPFALGKDAGAPPPVPDGAEGCPPLGFVSNLSGVAQRVVDEAVKGYQADKACAALLVDGVPFGHPEGLASTMLKLRDAVKAAVENPEGEAMPLETSGVIVAAADEAWSEEEQVYDIDGKKLPLAELVDTYAQICEDNWVKVIVQPFRADDLVEGCRLLKERCPDVHLAADFGADPPTALSKDFGYGYVAQIGLSAPVALQQYAERAKGWPAKGWPEGSARFASLGPSTAEWASSVEVALACGDTQNIMLPRDADENGAIKRFPDEGIKLISERIDDLLWRALYPCEDDP